MGIFEARESAVRSYCRTWPKVFDRAVDELILEPRHLNYRLQFPGPGGTNAVEAALKLARKVTGSRSSRAPCRQSPEAVEIAWRGSG
jgi:4-aminobutyrate aminotransferase-like enzyme